MSPRSGHIKISDRLISQLASAAIKKDIIRALAELITNSNDSYNRLEQRGIHGSGEIRIRINRKRKGRTIIEVIDEAEGMDDNSMSQKVCTYAADTSGFTHGENVRGYFGRGLKDSIIALGDGVVESIKDKVFYSCSLRAEANGSYQWCINDPLTLRKSEIKKITPELGIINQGTRVTININKDGVSVPQFDTIVECVASYFSLRDINSSSRRKVSICEIDDNGNERRKEKILYRFPLGEMILDKNLAITYNGTSINAHLRVHRAKERLDQTLHSYNREGGILVSSKDAIHSVTLFGQENNLYAECLFGRLECTFIDDLLKNNEPILSDKRSDIDWDHEFAKLLYKAADAELKPIVDAIREEEERKRRDIENDSTKERHRSAVKNINKIFEKELKALEGIGPGGGDKEIFPRDGFNFMPEHYTILAGRRSTVCLKAVVPEIIPIGTEIRITSESEDIEIAENQVTVITKEMVDSNHLVTINARIVGRQIGLQAFINADGGGQRAVALIEVVSKHREKEIGKEKNIRKSGGYIADIRLDSSLGPQIRTRFDRENRIISISTKAPSVHNYLGENGEGQNSSQFLVLKAELVVDAVCREIAQLKADKGKLLVLNNDFATAVSREVNNLVYLYAHSIHRFLVDGTSGARL